MRNAIMIGLALMVYGPAVAAAQDAPAAPASHWGAEFLGLTTPTGVAALRFTSPRAAWRIGGSLELSNDDEPNYDQRILRTNLSVGRRWFAPRRDRFQAFSGLGLIGGYISNHLTNSGVEQWSRVEQASVYGEIGGQIFVTDAIGFGAKWTATAGFDHYRSTEDGFPPLDRTLFRLRGGDVLFLGTLRL